MSLRRKPPQDSLDLLLDTMCNAFGGIIMLAVMVALIAREAPGLVGNPADDTRELVQRRIARAAGEVQRLKLSLSEMDTKASSPTLAERMRLVEERAEMQARLVLLQTAAAKEEAALREETASDPAARLAQLRSQLAAASARRVETTNSVVAVSEDLIRMRQRIDQMRKEVAQATEQSVQGLRLPREHETGKSDFKVIVRHGLLYPVYSPDLDRNTGTITWEPQAGGSHLLIPRPGLGIDPIRNPAAFAQLLVRLSKERFYVGFHVYEDSFAAFNAAKRIALASGLEYGWLPWVSDSKLVLGSSGSKPQPQ